MNDYRSFCNRIDVVIDNLDLDFKYKFDDPKSDLMEKGVLDSFELGSFEPENKAPHYETKKITDTDNKIKKMIRKILIIINQ